MKKIVAAIALFSIILLGCVQTPPEATPAPFFPLASPEPTALVNATPTTTPTQPAQSNASYSVNLSVSAPSVPYYYSQIVSAEAGDNAFELSSRYLTLDYAQYDIGKLITSVQNVSQDTGAGLYWQFYFNDELAPVGAEAFEITGDGVLEWRLEKPPW